MHQSSWIQIDGSKVILPCIHNSRCANGMGWVNAFLIFDTFYIQSQTLFLVVQQPPVDLQIALASLVLE